MIVDRSDRIIVWENISEDLPLLKNDILSEY